MDDTALMGVARINEAANFRKDLGIYLAALGQKINKDKSFIFFFNTPLIIQAKISRILRFQVGARFLLYILEFLFQHALWLMGFGRIFWINFIESLMIGHIDGSSLLKE